MVSITFAPKKTKKPTATPPAGCHNCSPAGGRIPAFGCSSWFNTAAFARPTLANHDEQETLAGIDEVTRCLFHLELKDSILADSGGAPGLLASWKKTSTQHEDQGYNSSARTIGSYNMQFGNQHMITSKRWQTRPMELDEDSQMCEDGRQPTKLFDRNDCLQINNKASVQHNLRKFFSGHSADHCTVSLSCDEKKERMNMAILQISKLFKNDAGILKEFISEIEDTCWQLSLAPDETKAMLPCLPSVAKQVSQNIHDMIKLHSTPGNCNSTESSKLLKFLACAVMYDRSLSRRQVQNIGLSRRRFEQAKEILSKMHDGSEMKSFVACVSARKKRSDCITPLLEEWLRDNVCHSDIYTRVDTNAKQICVNTVDEIYRMPTGGWMANSYSCQKHVLRNWQDVSSQQEIYEKVMSSQEWMQFVETFPEVPATISFWTFSRCLCTCVREEKSRSCVDVIKSQQRYLQKAVHEAIFHCPALQRALESCDCEYHQGMMRAKYVDWVAALKKGPTHFASLAMCPKVEYKFLKPTNCMDIAVEGPRMVQFPCACSQCKECGVEKHFKMLDCPLLTERTTSTNVILWENAPRPGEERFQLEPTQKQLPFNDVLVKLFHSTKSSMLHHFNCCWDNVCIDRLVADLDEDELFIKTDFSATPNLEAIELDNCSEANHCVLDIFCIISNKRWIDVNCDDKGNVRRIRVNDCTTVASIAKTETPGKKNDYRHHIVSLCWIVKKQLELAQQRGKRIKQITVATDNCPSQYKNQFVLYLVAAFSRYFRGIILRHLFAQKYNFKGVHDGMGKIIKRKWQKAEKRGKRISNAFVGFEDLFATFRGPQGQWQDWEEKRSIKLFHQKKDGLKTWTMTHADVLYVTECRDEFNKLQMGPYRGNVAYCDRERSFATCGEKSIKGISQIYELCGCSTVPCNGKDTSDAEAEWMVKLAGHLCACDHCSSKIGCSPGGSCAYKMIAQAPSREGKHLFRTIKVSDLSADPQRQELDKYENWLKQNIFGKKKYISISKLTEKLHEKLGAEMATNVIREATEQSRAKRFGLMRALYMVYRPEHVMPNSTMSCIDDIEDVDDMGDNEDVFDPIYDASACDQAEEEEKRDVSINNDGIMDTTIMDAVN